MTGNLQNVRDRRGSEVRAGGDGGGDGGGGGGSGGGDGDGRGGRRVRELL